MVLSPQCVQRIFPWLLRARRLFPIIIVSVFQKPRDFLFILVAVVVTFKLGMYTLNIRE